MITLPPDPYKILGVAKDASVPDIRAAHRKLVLKCHPDKVQDPILKEEKKDEFQRVQQAYELLSDENERQKYDDQVKFLERQKTAAKAMPSRYAFNVEIRSAEARPDSFAGSPPSKMYTHKQSSRSYEEKVHPGSARFFEEVNRQARRTASYEKPSRHDERDREREQRDREREREREYQREHIEREDRRRRLEEETIARIAAEKELRRAEKKKAEKARDKERKRETEDKRSRHGKPYVEEYVEDREEVYAVPKVSSDKKKSRKSEDKRESSAQREDKLSGPDTTSKMRDNMMQASEYLSRSRAKGAPPLTRAQTFAARYASPPRQPIAVPTPPPAGSSPFPSPSVEVEDDVRRSSARATGRRLSHDSPRSAKEKPSHRKTVSGSKDGPGSPIITPATPPVGGLSEPRPGDLPRASTMNAADFARSVPMPMPGIRRSDTEPIDPRGRSRSRFQPQIEIEEIDDEPPPEREYRSSGGKHRSSRHKTRSPSPQAYRAPVHRYQVEGARTVPVEQWYHDEPPRQKSSKHHGASYVTTSGSKGGAYQRVVELRPSMPPRESSYSSSGHYPKLRMAKNYGVEDIAYSRHGAPEAYREEYGSAWA